MAIKQISIFVSNMTGGLADVLETIGNNNIDISALSIADTTDFGILRLIVDDPDTALSVLKESGYVVSVTDVVAVSIKDCPGGLANVLRILANENIPVEYVYAFVAGDKDNLAYVVLRLENNEAASKVLESHGIALLEQSDIV